MLAKELVVKQTVILWSTSYAVKRRKSSGDRWIKSSSANECRQK